MHVVPVGPVELVRVRPWASVRRVPLAAGAAWFKACAPVQAFEPRLTTALARRTPDLLPEVLAHDEERAWLLLADAGRPIGLDSGPEPWLSLLPRYAELQRREARDAREHLDAGVPDRRPARFAGFYEALLGRDLPLADDDAGALRAFAPRLAELCAELEASGVPTSVQHDDLHGNNVYGRGAALRVLDWGDACVSHPFLTAFVTFLHLAETREPQLDEGWAARLRDAYLEPWGRPRELRAAFAVAERLGPFAHLFKELRVLDATPEAERPRHAPDLRPLLELCLAATGRGVAAGCERGARGWRIGGAMQVRLARHTDRLPEVARFYGDGLGLPRLGGFEDHDGYSGVFFGLPGTGAHLEFTTGGAHGAPPPHPETLLVLYLGDAAAVEAASRRVRARPVEPANPYWRRGGAVTLVDPDGFGVVLVPSPWPDE